jgi:hypothetical protein
MLHQEAGMLPGLVMLQRRQSRHGRALHAPSILELNLNLARRTIMKRIANFALALVFVLAAGFAGRALADGTEKTVSGTLEDAYCYGTMGAKGSGHKQCAIKCASAGIPVTLIESSTEKSYILLPNKDDSPLPQNVIQHMEDQVTVTGKEYNKNGTDYIVVESIK